MTPEFLHATMSRFAARQRKKESLARKPFYKTVTLNVDHAGRSDRKEWGHLKYQHYYDPSEAFEIAIQWSVASGNCVHRGCTESICTGVFKSGGNILGLSTSKHLDKFVIIKFPLK